MTEKEALDFLEVAYALETSDNFRAAFKIAMVALKKKIKNEEELKRFHKALVDAGIIFVKKGENENVKND